MRLTTFRLRGSTLGRVTASALLVLVGCCGPHTRLEPFERALGTNSSLGFEFHRVVDDPNGLGLRSRGFVVGFEKTWRGTIGCPKPAELAFRRHVDLDLLHSAERDAVKRHLRERLDDWKCLFLTHIVEYLPAGLGNAEPSINPAVPLCGAPDHIDRRPDAGFSVIDHVFHYNLYCRQQELTSTGSEQMSTKEARGELVRDYEASWLAIERFRHVLERAAHDYQTSHIMLYVMGWSSGQQEALRNVNSIHLSIMRDANARGATGFNPLPILVTWPSHWRLAALSYPNKADDADELGAVFLNALIHRAILPAARSVSARTVAIAHSFGARATSRALFSGEILVAAGDAEPKWDLFVGLEPAFSIRRFTENGAEGDPYSRIADHVRKIVLTWSAFDTANPIAFWSDHAGGRRGAARAEQVGSTALNDGRPSLFEFAKVSANGSIEPCLRTGPEAIAYLDASELVRFENYAKSGGAHSDIYTAAMGHTLMELIDGFATAAPVTPCAAPGAHVSEEEPSQ
jgi:hypothetical protein